MIDFLLYPKKKKKWMVLLWEMAEEAFRLVALLSLDGGPRLVQFSKQECG